MKKLHWRKINTFLCLMFGLCFLTSLVGALVTGFVYQANNNELTWLHFVTEALGGTFFCSGGMFSILTSEDLWSQTNYWFVKKIIAVPVFLIGMFLLFAGLFLLWRAMGNLFEYMVF
jgi:hypothetical protein